MRYTFGEDIFINLSSVQYEKVFYFKYRPLRFDHIAGVGKMIILLLINPVDRKHERQRNQ